MSVRRLRPCHRESGEPKKAFADEVEAAAVAADINARTTPASLAAHGGQPVHHYPCAEHGWHVGRKPRKLRPAHNRRDEVAVSVAG